MSLEVDEVLSVKHFLVVQQGVKSFNELVLPYLLPGLGLLLVKVEYLLVNYSVLGLNHLKWLPAWSA